MKPYRKYHAIALLIPASLIFLVSCTSSDPTPSNPPIVSVPILGTNSGFISDKPVASSSGVLALPLDRALERVTKKTFWLRVSPGHSPVSPERFTGYHTGIDFETFPSEQNMNVAVRTICAGPLILKKRATGYGGVAVQQCRLKWQDVTIVYGHLKLESVGAPANSVLQPGQKLWILGKGFSPETDGERKHLHLSIHIGSEQDIRGYVSTRAELSQWIDPMKHFK